jgi:hypothetical protein
VSREVWLRALSSLSWVAADILRDLRKQACDLLFALEAEEAWRGPHALASTGPCHLPCPRGALGYFPREPCNKRRKVISWVAVAHSVILAAIRRTVV